MELNDYSLRQMDENDIRKLPEAALRDLAVKLLQGNYSDPLSQGNCSDCPCNSPVQGEKCEFTRVNDHFSTQKWRISGGI